VKAAGHVLILASLVMPLACTSLSAQQDVPALITNPDEQSRAELLRVVSSALNRAAVTIAADALTRESVLTIEQRPPRDLENRPLTGRVLGMPEQFRLVMSGSKCVLVHQSDGKRTELTATRCRASGAQPGH